MSLDEFNILLAFGNFLQPPVVYRARRLFKLNKFIGSVLVNLYTIFFKELSGNIHANDLDCIVLDYVGFPVGQVLQLQKSIQIPVFDLGQLTMMTLASTLQPGHIDFGGQK